MKETFSIFVDCHIFDGEFQGSRTYVKEIYSYLIRTKSNIRFYLAAHDIENLRNEFPVRPNVIFLKYRSKNKFLRLGYEIPKLIKQYKTNFAHFQYICPIIKNSKFIITTHDVLFSDFPQEFPWSYRVTKKYLFKISAHKADIFLTDSEYSKKSISKFLSLSKHLINVIPAGIDDSFFQEYDIQKSKDYIIDKYNLKNYILYVSRVEPRKNHSLIIRVFQELKLYERGISLVFIGSESIVSLEMQNAIKSLHEQEKKFYHHLSNIPYKDLLEFYRASTLCVYPSKGEGFGIPPLESAAIGKPTICANNTSLEDFAFLGNRHINASDYDTWKKVISLFFETGFSIESLSEIQSTVKKTYSWQKSAEKTYELIVKQNTK